MSNNPSLGIEFHTTGTAQVLGDIDKVSRRSQAYVDWLANLSRAERNHTRTAVEESSRRARMATAEADAFIKNGERILAMRQKQLAMESRVSNAGGYGPNLPSTPSTVAQQSSALNTGLVNAAAFLSVATRAYYMASQAVGVISGFVTEAAKWEAMEIGLRNMEGSAQGAAQATEHLYELAKAPAIELATATKAYLQLRSLHMAGSDAERVIRNISNTIARSGGGSVEFERVLRQMTQMLAKGKVLEQDLRIMKEAMPELATLMQKAFGETTAEGIRKQGVNAKQFVETMLTEMDKLPKAQQTLQSEIENTQVAWSRLKAAFVDTDWTKQFLSNITRAFEAARIAIRGTAEEKKRAEYESSIRQQAISGAKFRSSPVGYALGKLGFKNYDTEYNRSEADIQEQMNIYDAARRVEKIKAEQTKVHSRFAKEKTEKGFSGKIDGMTEAQWIALTAKGTAAFAPNSEGVATGKSGTEDGKKKTTKEFKYDLEWWSKQHSDAQAEINKLNREDLLNAEKLLAYYDEMDKKELAAAEERKKAWLEEESAVAKHQKSVDEWNQKQIDKNREKNQAGNALLGEINPLRAIENEYIAHYERINEANFASQEERDRVNEYFRLKEQQATREFYAAQYSLAVSGASDMFGALAELRKNQTSEENDTYKVLFGISKAFAIADATIKLSSAAINAMAVGSSQGIPVMLANIGTTMAAGGGLISQINATAYSGVFDKGGYIPRGGWGIAGENGPEIIQGPAHVTSTRDTARLIGGGSGAPVINVNNYAGVAVSTKSNRDGNVDILIQRAAEVAEERIASGIASGGGKVAQQMTRTFGVKR